MRGQLAFRRARATFSQCIQAYLLAELVGDKNPCSIGVLAAFRIDRAVQARLWRDVGCAGNLAGPPDWRDNGEGFSPEAKALARRLWLRLIRDRVVTTAPFSTGS